MVPFQPLHFHSCHFGPVAVIEPPLTYSAPWCQARPATNPGEPGSSVAVPFFSTNTPPFGGAVFDSTPPSPSNTAPPPNANDVGV